MVTTEGKTLLPQYLGMYRLTVNNAETYWMVMRNVFSSTVKIHRKFDLKGSRVDRAASHKEKVCFNSTLNNLVPKHSKNRRERGYSLNSCSECYNHIHCLCSKCCIAEHLGSYTLHRQISYSVACTSLASDGSLAMQCF